MTGIFDNLTDQVFTTYHARLRYRDRVVGGTPSTPKLIEGWIRKNAGSTQADENRALMARTIQDLGLADDLFNPDGSINFPALERVSEEVAKSAHTTMFKRDSGGLYLEGRIIKAMLKECTAILWPGTAGMGEVNSVAKPNKWGQTGGAPRAKLAEWVFTKQDRIYLGVQEPTGVDLSIGHVTGPQGPRSTLDYYEYVERAEIEFDVIVLEDRVPDGKWPLLWVYAQENGLGSKRSQGFDRFDILEWTLVSGARK